MPVDLYATPVDACTTVATTTTQFEARTTTSPLDARTTTTTTKYEAHTSRSYEARTTMVVEDDSSLGGKAVDTLSNAVENVKEFFTPTVKDSDIADAALKYQELTQQEQLDLARAGEAERQRQKLLVDAKHMEAEELVNLKKVDLDREQRHKLAEKIVHLQNTQHEQQAEKYRKAMMRGGTFPEDVKVTQVTDIR